MKINIVIPAFNEQKRIAKVLKELKKFKIPIIVVDDGSQDKTSLVAKKQADLVLTHRVNLGKGAALKTGVEAAFLQGAEAVIVMDADGQHKSSDLPNFEEALKKGYEVVIGSRNFGLGVPLIRFLGNKLASVLISFLFGVYVSDLLCGYRAFTKKAYQKMLWESPGYGVETEMIARLGKSHLKFCEVPVETIYLDRFKGVTLFDAIFLLGHVIFWRITI